LGENDTQVVIERLERIKMELEIDGPPPINHSFSQWSSDDCWLEARPQGF
jgi:hypothetical protein